AHRHFLGQGAGNRDKKQSLTAAGKTEIKWIFCNAPFPVSVFLTTPAEVVSRIWLPSGGQERVNELFRSIRNTPITRVDISALAKQKDPANRARKAAPILRKEGIVVVCGRYIDRRQQATDRGINLATDEWVSF